MNTPVNAPSLTLARSAVQTLQDLGVPEVVVCAGARNAALVAVLARTPSLKIWSFPEERSAAFFALGRALALQAPVAVVTTSGTAVAELLPATIEAWYQGLPLLLVTADRPRIFRGTGAPQAIEQPGLFSTYVFTCGDVADTRELAGFRTRLTGWNRQSPVHLNLCLEEPTAGQLARELNEDHAPATENLPAPPPPTRDHPHTLENFLADQTAGPLLAIVAALPAREHAAVTAFLRRLRCPVVAEATSGLRESPELATQLVHGSETTLAGLPVGRVLRIGAVPSLRYWRNLEQQPQVRVLSLTPTAFPGLARPSTVCPFPHWPDVSLPPEPSAASASAAATTATATAATATTAACLALHPRSEPALIHALSAHLPQASLVFLGNSLPIREWNAFASIADRHLRCHANRGANGIDGCISTFLGLSAQEPESWAVIGDLTALYDLVALWITPALPPARRRLVVINNGGGRIFAQLPALQTLDPGTRQLMENPHSLNFRAWADMFGWSYLTASHPDEISAAAASRQPYLLIEVVPEAAATQSFWQSLHNHPGPAATPHTPSPANLS